MPTAAGDFANKLFQFIVDPLITLLVFVGIFLLVVQVVRYISSTDAQDKGTKLLYILGTIFGLFIMTSVWVVFRFVGEVADSPRELQPNTVEIPVE